MPGSDCSYQPSISPDGEWVVFESHALDVEDNGAIMKFPMDGTGAYQSMTDPKQDCRQPNWSPNGDKNIYQKSHRNQWDLWVMDPDGANQERITTGAGDKTDASFSPDGCWLVYSWDEPSFEFANIYITPRSGGDPVRVTYYEGYDGAPSWPPDGKWIVFESYPGDRDDSPGTTIWIIGVPEL